jgi:hypothetical protein
VISRAQREAPRDLSFTSHHLTPHASATIDNTEAKGSKG